MNFKIKVLMTVVAVSASSLALAQNKNFTGFSAGANVNFANSKTETIFIGGGSAQASENAQNASLQGQYGFGISDKFVIGLGVTYGLGELKAGTVTFGGAPVSRKLKDQYSINIEPGYVVSASTLAYAKVGFQGAKGESSVSNTGAMLTGYGYGIGFRTMLTPKLYLQGEYQQISFDKKNEITGVDIKADQGVASIGVGYKF